MFTKLTIIVGVAVAMLFLLAILFFMRERLLLAIGDYLVVQDELRPADVIHVIAGPDHRAEYAFQLYNEGYGGQLFFTGGWCQIHNVFHGQHAQALAERERIPRKDISIDDSPVTSTYDEVVRLKSFLAQSKTPLSSVIVVSDPFHMRRARWTYRQVLGDKVQVRMAPVPFDRTPYQRRWWVDELSRSFVKDEYLKFAYYFVRYKLAIGPLQDWLGIFDR